MTKIVLLVLRVYADKAVLCPLRCLTIGKFYFQF
jgi:hypothetical protein